MGRRSVRLERRADILKGFSMVLASHGFSGATMVTVAEASGVSPGLLHHHFKNKKEMLFELFKTLVEDFRQRLKETPNDLEHPLENYINKALQLNSRSNAMAAKCWVSIFAEALRDKGLMENVKKYLDKEIRHIQELSAGKLGTNDASAILSYVLGALVFGAFAHKRTKGFAAEGGIAFVDALLA